MTEQQTMTMDEIKAHTVRHMTEKALTTEVRRLAKKYDWEYYHTWISINSDPGFPDLVLVRERSLLAAKGESERRME